jgi:hypothetical protein
MIEAIFFKREQVRFFDQINVPSADLINELLLTTVKLVPSKQNMMPYKIHVLGPEHIKTKEILYTLASKQELPNDYQKRLSTLNSGNTALFAPYVLLFEKRIPIPNRYILQLISRGHRYPECDPSQHYRHNKLAAIEVGLFSSILTGLCLEKEISVSYTECLPNVNRNNLEDQNPIKINPYAGLINFINEDIFLALSLGYQDKNINDHERLSKHTNVGEDKPVFEEIIHWQKI